MKELCLQICLARQLLLPQSLKDHLLQKESSTKMQQLITYWYLEILQILDLKLLVQRFLISAVSWQKIFPGLFFLPQIQFLWDSSYQWLREARELSLQFICIILEETYSLSQDLSYSNLSTKKGKIQRKKQVNIWWALTLCIYLNTYTHVYRCSFMYRHKSALSYSESFAIYH